MGCDIHPVVFVAKSPGRTWREVAGIPNRDRFYAFFGALAGVRVDCAEPIAPGRGRPMWLAAEEYDELTCAGLLSGQHSLSWAALSEIDSGANDARLSTEVREQFAKWAQFMRECQKQHEWEPGCAEPVVVFDFDS